jgi:hypothetical protein
MEAGGRQLPIEMPIEKPKPLQFHVLGVAVHKSKLNAAGQRLARAVA